MNKKLLESIAVLNGDSSADLAKCLGITPQALAAKKKGTSDFKRKEIAKIKTRYGLSAADIDEIFFGIQVSQKETIS